MEKRKMKVGGYYAHFDGRWKKDFPSHWHMCQVINLNPPTSGQRSTYVHVRVFHDPTDTTKFYNDNVSTKSIHGPWTDFAAKHEEWRKQNQAKEERMQRKNQIHRDRQELANLAVQQLGPVCDIINSYAEREVEGSLVSVRSMPDGYLRFTMDPRFAAVIEQTLKVIHERLSIIATLPDSETEPEQDEAA